MCDECKKLERRLERARGILKYCADPLAHFENQRGAARDALKEIWPKPRQIEVGGEYVAEDGSRLKCIAIDGGVAYLLAVNSLTARAALPYALNGTKGCNMAYSIDWSRC